MRHWSKRSSQLFWWTSSVNFEKVTKLIVLPWHFLCIKIQFPGTKAMIFSSLKFLTTEQLWFETFMKVYFVVTWKNRFEKENYPKHFYSELDGTFTDPALNWKLTVFHKNTPPYVENFGWNLEWTNETCFYWWECVSNIEMIHFCTFWTFRDIYFRSKNQLWRSINRISWTFEVFDWDPDEIYHTCS